MTGTQVSMRLSNHRIDIAIDRHQSNVPIFINSFVLEREEKMAGPKMCSLLAHSRLYKLDFLAVLEQPMISNS